MLGTNSTILFKTKNGGRYAYDDNTGAVFPVNNILSKALQLYRKLAPHRVRTELLMKFPKEYVEGALKFIERWRQTYGGLYRTPLENASIRRNKMSYASREDIATSILQNPTSFRQLILNVTEDCNLMCKYCIYSDNYKYTRAPTNKAMTFETGQKALDYFFSLNEPVSRRHPAKLLAVNFYGGEPLLGFSTIKKLAPYAKQNSPLPLFLLMTTNGLLLKDEAVDFIVENDIHVAISLDGTKENHDRNRITSSGKGSWTTVRRNLTRFMERYPEFSRKNLNLISVYDLRTDLEANARFFEQEHLPRVSFADYVNPSSETYYSQFSEEEKNRFIEQYQNLMRTYVQHLLDGTRPPDFLTVFSASRFVNILYRPAASDLRPNILPFTNTCIPGEKISVRADGVFDICERVNNSMPIGDVEQGLDMDAIARVIEKYKGAHGEKCLSCPMTKLCNVCFGDGICMQDGEFSIPAERCRHIRSEMTQCLSLVYSIREQKANAFEYVEELLSRPEKIQNF